MGFESEPATPDNEDVFGSQSVKNVSNESNLAGHYAYSPERWRLFDGDKATGTRLAPEYDDVPEYNHVGDYHELKPSGGQTVVFESAERYRYVVNFETEVSFTPRINQELQGDDYVRVGFYDGTDGWFLEHNGGHAPDEIDMVLLRDGSEVYRTATRLSTDDLLARSRIALETAWYDVSRQKWSQSFGEGGRQINTTIGRESHFKERGAKKGNQHLRYEVQADADTSGLVLEAGSTALITKGGGEENNRVKSKQFTASVDTADRNKSIISFGTSTF